MAGLFLPPRVEREILKEKWVKQRAERRVVLMRLLDFDGPVCREWTPVLQRLDPFLSLGRAKPMAYVPGFNVRPNYYHVVRDNPTADLSVTAITGPDGESFAEPDSGVLNRLRGNDLQHPAVWRALVEHDAARERAREAEEATRRVEMDSEVLERWKAASETQVSLSDGRWSQNVSGRRGTKR